MVFQIAATDKMKLLSNGNLLIGTTTDSGDKLTVAGNLGSYHSGYTTDAFRVTHNSNDVFLSLYKRSNQSTPDVKLRTNGNCVFANQVTIPATPVASTDAASKGYVDAQVGSADTLQEVTDNGNTTTNQITITDNHFQLSDAYSIKWGSTFNNRIYNQNSNFVFIGNGSEKMRLTSGGNVGINTTNPTSKLYVKQSDYASSSTPTGDDTLTIERNGSNYLNIIANAANYSGILFSDDARAIGNILYNHPGNYMRFVTNGAEQMRISNAGNVGIGTTYPASLLHVAGTVQVGVDDTGHDVIFYGATSGRYMRWDESSNALHLQDETPLKIGAGGDLQILHNSTESFLHNSTGNLTVKTDTGDIKIRNFANDRDVILETDNGTGGTTPYITLDGSQTTINLQQIVLIGTTTNSGVYKLDVAGKARVQSVFELDDVLTLNQISTPADPASGQSSIYMDSADGAIKVKINVGGTVVTRTIASFE